MIEVPPELRAVLEAAQQHGAIGPGSIDDAIAHALGFWPEALGLAPNARVIDLGSGGGLPGLPLALTHPASTWRLVDSWEARVDALRRAVRALGLGERVDAIHARAEDLGRGDARGTADVVVARGFGPPAMTAECAAPLLRPGGLLVVSTSPDGGEWPGEVAAIGLQELRRWRTDHGSYVAYVLGRSPESRFPRRPAAMRRSPLF